MPEYDFLSRVREELKQLGKELAEPNVRPAIGAIAARLGVDEHDLLAAMWRASKRHGETLAVFAHELNQQFTREAASGPHPTADLPHQ